MENNNNNQSFWQFSDQLRLQNANLANLSLNDSIWSVNDQSKRPETRRNFDIRVGGELLNTNNVINNNNKTPTTPTTPTPTPTHNFNYNNNYSSSPYDFKHKGPSTPTNTSTNDYNAFNNGWKLESALNTTNFTLPPTPTTPHNFINNGVGGFSKDNVYTKPYSNQTNNLYTPTNFNLGVKGYYNSKFDHIKTNNNSLNNDESNNLYSPLHQQQYNRTGKKNSKDGKKKENGKDDGRNGVDKRFKTLPPSEALPRNETIGGYIFVCNNDTMEENLKRQLFGLPPRYRDSVRAITPGLPLFLYNYSTHQLHGIYEAASFGGTNIDATAWEDKKNPGESRFPAQVRVQTRKICDPLDEDAFRPILHHYDGPKFRLELSIPEAISLLDIFAETISS